MLVRLPSSLHYPITVTSLLKQPGDAVEREDALFWYVYQTTVTEGDGLGNKVEVKRKFPTKFESPVDGELVQWRIAKGDVINGPYVTILNWKPTFRGSIAFTSRELRLTSSAMFQGRFHGGR